MKKFLALALALTLVLSLAACGGNTPAPGSAPAGGSTPASEPAGDDGPSGTVVVYSPHDADPLNDGVNMFMEKYPNIQLEVVGAGTAQLGTRIKA